MKDHKVPLWIYNGYKTEIELYETKLKNLRQLGLFGLVPETLAILDSLKHTLNNIEKSYQGRN
jgi:hypothetical protein